MPRKTTGNHPELKPVNFGAAAIDIGSKMHMAAVRQYVGSHSGSDSHPMKFSAELAVLQRGNQRHASRYSNFVACTEWVGYRERK